jgi:hypothetical protein
MAGEGTLIQLLNDVYIEPNVTLAQYSILRIITSYETTNDNGSIDFFYKLAYIEQTFSIRTDEVRHLTREEVKQYNEKFLLLDDCAVLLLESGNQGTILIKAGTVFCIDTFRPIDNTYYPVTITDDIVHVSPIHKSILYSDVEIATNILTERCKA